MVITPGKAVKGVGLDTKRTFAEQFNKTTEKTEKTTKALTKLMPDIIINSSQPSACLAINSKAGEQKDMQRIKTITTKGVVVIVRLFPIELLIEERIKTITTKGVVVIVRLFPIELLIEERKRRYEANQKRSPGQHARRSGTLIPMQGGRVG
ncbi:hypothetical protein QE152_g31524 [Popillia japonica]|uniref:Uncharacterized protein n=1 Tax=Popillia japonica TaxID=7064 RepID=A0AAW1J0K9_POPJA